MRGDLLLCHGSGPLARLIQWRTQGPFDHVAIDLGREFQLGAEPDGIRARPLSALGPHVQPIVVRRFGATDAGIERGLTLVGHLLDDGYAYLDLLDDLFPRWLPVRPLLGQRKAVDCSDLVARYLDEAGILPLAELGADAKTVTPNDLARAFQGRGLLQREGA